MTRILSNLLELLGILAILFGAYAFDWRLALVGAGVVLVILGYALDVPRRAEADS